MLPGLFREFIQELHSLIRIHLIQHLMNLVWRSRVQQDVLVIVRKRLEQPGRQLDRQIAEEHLLLFVRQSGKQLQGSRQRNIFEKQDCVLQPPCAQKVTKLVFERNCHGSQVSEFTLSPLHSNNPFFLCVFCDLSGSKVLLIAHCRTSNIDPSALISTGAAQLETRMPSNAIAPIILFLAILLTLAQLLGYLFARLRQPRVIGEILAGVLLGPFVLGKWAAYSHLLQLDVAAEPKKAALDLIYYMGLLLLMFLSGAETKALFHPDERKQIGWLASVGTLLPFALMLLLAPLLPLDWFMGVKDNRIALVLVMSIAVAVTSIPVISRIFFDLKILHTRFARLVLGVAVLEDIALWAVLAITTAAAESSALPQKKIALHIGLTLLYLLFGLTIAPRALKRISKSRFNLLANNSPVTFTLLIGFG